MTSVQLDSRNRQLTEGPLSIEVGPEHETCLMRVSGELDLSTVSAFESELQRLLSTELTSVVLDLADLEFIGSSGLQALVRAARRSRANGDHLRIIAPSGRADEILRLSGIRQTLPLIS